jgi:undecaprenyl-diphosphatase
VPEDSRTTPGRLWPLSAVAVVCFAVLTWRVSAGGRLVSGDGRVLREFRRSAAGHGSLTSVAHVLCDLGDIQVAVPVLVAALAAAALLGRRAGLVRWWAAPAVAAVAMLVLPVVVSAVKAGVDRPAPGRVRADPDYGYFPSGHTATSSVGFGLAVLVLLPFVRSAAARLLLVHGTVLVAVAVGASLVWCGYHWPLDVVASWLLAVALLSAASAVTALVGRGSGSPPDGSGHRPDGAG